MTEFDERGVDALCLRLVAFCRELSESGHFAHVQNYLDEIESGMNNVISDEALLARFGFAIAAERARLQRLVAQPLSPTYKLGLVGESFYQSAISNCLVGETVDIVREVGNPYDDRAVAVISRAGLKIGHVGRDSWLQRAIHDEDRGCGAKITSIARGNGGSYGVVLEVFLTEVPVGEIPYRA